MGKWAACMNCGQSPPACFYSALLAWNPTAVDSPVSMLLPNRSVSTDPDFQ
jgi:hypothetical protein